MVNALSNLSIAASMAILFVPFLTLLIILLIREQIIYRKIRKTGIAGFGRLISCKRNYFVGIRVAILPQYDPIIEFYYAEKRYEMRALGHFGVRPGKVGDEIAIIFWEEHPDKVIIRDKHILDSHIVEVLLYLTIGLLLICIIS